MDYKEKTFIATNLKYLRELSNRSLNDVARICDKTDVAVHYWENGAREPNAVDIAKLSNYFNVSIDDLLSKDLRLKENFVPPDELDLLYSKSKGLLNESELDMVKHSMQRAIERYEEEKRNGN